MREVLWDRLVGWKTGFLREPCDPSGDRPGFHSQTSGGVLRYFTTPKGHTNFTRKISSVGTSPTGNLFTRAMVKARGSRDTSGPFLDSRS